MTLSRRRFLSATAAAAAMGPVGLQTRIRERPLPTGRPPERYDPWIEVDAAALVRNAREVARLSGGRPILAVVKNDAYGLGVTVVGRILDAVKEVVGFAVVKSDQAIALREAGVTKPVLLMGLFAEADGPELMRRRVQFAPYTETMRRAMAGLATRFDRPVQVHCYVDTGMSRLGMPYRRALDWITAVAAMPEIEIRGTFTALVETDDFDSEQVARLLALARRARERGASLGRLHASSSHGLFFRPDALLDLVRPGLCLYGAYPAGARALDAAALRPAVRLCARVVRVERLEPGDTVSYGREYVAERPTWVATLPVGHADGYPRRAVSGCQVLIGERTYPVIGAVSASHTIVEVGGTASVRVGDVATLIGSDHPSIHPNAVAERAEISVYDVLMHLNAALPKWVV